MFNGLSFCELFFGDKLDETHIDVYFSLLCIACFMEQHEISIEFLEGPLRYINDSTSMW